MGTSYDPTTYLNQQATTAPFTSRVASAARAASFKPTNRELTKLSDLSEAIQVAISPSRIPLSQQ